MRGQSHGGKGSAQRPTDQTKYATNWDAIFGDKLRGLRSEVDKQVLEPEKVQRMPTQTQTTAR